MFVCIDRDCARDKSIKLSETEGVCNGRREGVAPNIRP